MGKEQEEINRIIERCKKKRIPPGAIRKDDESEDVHYLKAEKVEQQDRWEDKFKVQG